MNKSIDIVALFDNYRNAEETLNERIASLVVYNQGSLNYDQMWSLTEKEMSRIEKLISEKIKMLAKSGISF